MTELAEWLRKQLAEDEKRARDPEALTVWLAEKLLMARGLGTTTSMPLGEAREEWMPTARAIIEEIEDEPESWYATRAGVLADVAAKRRMVDECAVTIRQGLSVGLAETMLAMLALPYADRPGFKEKWRP